MTKKQNDNANEVSFNETVDLMFDRAAAFMLAIERIAKSYLSKEL